MRRLTDSQLVILTAAAKRDTRAVLPLPGSLKARGAAAQKILASLVGRGLAEPISAGAQDTVWREEQDGHGMALRITDAGLAAIGIGDEGKAATSSKIPGKDNASKAKRPPGKSGDSGSRPGIGTPSGKGGAVVALLKRKGGASIAEMSEATGWQTHSMRGFLSGTVKKKLGLTVTSDRDAGGVRRYRIAKTADR